METANLSKLTPELALKCLQRDTPKGQKFPRGSRVRIADDLGPTMSHFTKAANATVLGTYKQSYGGGLREAKMYQLDIDGHGYCSWYYEHQLTLIEE